MHALVIEIDPLPARRLGCYGSLRAVTPGFDALASESVVFDQHLSIDALRHSSSAPAGNDPHTSDFRGWLSRHGVNIVEEQFRFSSGCGGDPMGNGLTSHSNNAARGSLHWIRLDAGEENVEGDSSEWFRWLDRQIASCHAALRGCDSSGQPLWFVFGRRGTSPAERPEIPAWQRPFQSPHVQTPLIVRDPRNTWGSRRQSLVSSSDIGPTLCEWFRVSPPEDAADAHSLMSLLRDEALSVRTRVVVQADGAAAIRTPDWFLAAPLTGGPLDGARYVALEECRLYRKPHDAGDVLDVAGQSPAVVEELVRELQSALDNREATGSAALDSSQ